MEALQLQEGNILVKGEKIRKGMEGRNDSQCLLAFYKELYSLEISVSFPSSLFFFYRCRLVDF